MNERIKQLAEQAGIYIAYDNRAVTDKELEYFGELIVKECVGIVENLSPGYQDYRNQIEDAFRNDCIAEIKYRFGVEE